MSDSDIREKEETSLKEVPPSVTALTVFLTKWNKGIRVYEKHKIKNAENNRHIHVMSNGLSYSKDEYDKWYVI